MIIQNKNSDTIASEIIQQVRDGIILVEREKYVYDAGVQKYFLSGAGSGTVSIIDIVYVEGINSNGFYIPPYGTFNGIGAWVKGVDYNLFSDIEAYAPSYAGTVAGDSLFQYIEFSGSSTPMDGSDLYVTYKYFDSNKVINPERPTSFSSNGIANAFVYAFSSILDNMYNELALVNKQQHIQTASGYDLDIFGANYNLSRLSASKSTGIVQVTNNGTDDITLTASHRFTTTGTNKIVFIPTTTPTLSVGNTVNVYVESVDIGASQNVGVRAITLLYKNDSLTSLEDVDVTNPGVINGESNLFNNGSNEESDTDYRVRLLSVINKRGNATKKSIEGAINTLSDIKSSKVFDWSDKKYLNPPVYQIFVIGNDEKVIRDTSIFQTIQATVENVQPVSATPIITTPMGIWINISGSVYIDRNYYADRSIISSNISQLLTTYIDSLNVGEDAVHSEMIRKGMSVNRVKKFNIDSIRYSEFSFRPYDISTEITLYSGSTDIPYTQSFPKLSNSFADVYIYSGSISFTMSGTNISSSVTPSVYITVQDNNGIWVRDPAYAIDWYSSTGTDTISIDANAGSGSGIALQSGSTHLLFIYESFETHTLDGLITQLGSNLSGTVELSLWSGTSEPTTKFKSGSFDLVSGTNTIDWNFSGTHTFDSGTQYHWLVVSGTSGESYVPVETSQQVPLSTLSVYYYSGANWVAKSSGHKYMYIETYNIITDSSDVSIPKLSNISEIAVLDDISINEYIYVGDEQ